jgi:DNA-binding Lrp family transcriptional regulator
MPRTNADDALLALLRDNARAPVAELARQLGLSRTTVQARIERLERSGVIAGYSVRLSESAERALIKAHVLITVYAKQMQKTVIELRQMPEIRTLHSVSGEVDLIAVVVASSVADLDRVIDLIGSLEGVGRTQSSVILATKIDR